MRSLKVWEERRERIQLVAYFRAERRGFEPGHDVEDWLTAEPEIDATWHPRQEVWAEAIEELIESARSLHDLFDAFDPLLPTLPQPLVLRIAETAISVNASKIDNIANSLTQDSLRELWKRRQNWGPVIWRVTAVRAIVSRVPELTLEAVSALCEIDNSKTRGDSLGEIADFVPDEQLPAFWRVILGDKSVLVRARLASQEFHRMQPEFWPEAERVATSSDQADSTDWYSKYFKNYESVARVALLHKLTSAKPTLWPTLVEQIANLTFDLSSWEEAQKAKLFATIVSDLPPELAENLIDQIISNLQYVADYRSEILELVAERFPKLWPKVLEGYRRISASEKKASVPNEVWANASTSQKAKYIAELLFVERKAKLLARVALSYPEIWPDAISAAMSANLYSAKDVEHLEWLAEILPAEEIPAAIQALLRLDLLSQTSRTGLYGWAYHATGVIRRLIERLPREMLPDVIAAAKRYIPQRTAFLILHWIAAQDTAELRPFVVSAAADNNAGWDVLSVLFRAPSDLLITSALEKAAQSDKPEIRARLLTLIAPHRPELWGEVIQAIRSITDQSIRSECLQTSVKYLPLGYLNAALDVMDRIDELHLRAKILPDLVAYGPQSLIPEVLFRVSELPRMRKACALSKIAFYVPSPTLEDIFRLAPWSDSAAINIARDRLKAYISVLPPRLARNFLVILLQHLYKEWISEDGRFPRGLFGPVSKEDPSRPPDSYWEFRKEDWNLALECSVFTGKSLRKDEWFVLSVWLHVPAERTQVRELLKELNRDSIAGRTTGLRSAKGSRVSISFQPQHLQLKPDPNQPANSIVKSFVWQGDPVNMDVIAKYPTLDGEDHIFETANILVEDLKVGEVVIELDFHPGRGQASSTFRQIESAFASYSRQDVTEVIAHLQAIEKMAPGIRLFWDVESLRSGDKWEERLAEEVVNKDIFYLFWSENAAKSKWVNWEWSCAYDKRGIDYIDPFPLDQTKPPQKLESLQFADRWVRHLEYEKLKALAMPAEN
jgi:hypothetical protein